MGWEVKKLSSVSVIEKVKHDGSLMNYVGLEHIESNTGKFAGAIEPKSVASSTFRFNDKHVLYGRLRPYLNKVSLPDFEGHCSTEIFPMKTSKDLDREFLFYWLSMLSTVEKINGTCTGARMPRANMKEVMEFDIPVPPLEEQKKIVAILDQAFAEIDKARANAQQNLNNARELFDSYLNQVFSQRGEGWVVKKFSECFKLRSGVGLTKKNMVEGPYPVYGGNGIAGFHNDYNLCEKSVIIGRVGAMCGNARFIYENIWLTDNAFLVKDFKFDFDLEFLTYLLNYKNLRSLARQAAQPVISNSSLSDLKLEFPLDLSTQKKIKNNFELLRSELESISRIYKNKLKLLAELKKSILQKAFSGELTG